MELEDALNAISKEIRFIYDNEESFMEHFCGADVIDIRRITFDSRYIYFEATESFEDYFDVIITINNSISWKEELEIDND